VALLEQTPAPELRLVQDELTSGDPRQREKAWRALVDAHYPRIYRLVCRFGVEPAEVEDIVQRALVVAFRRIHEVDDVRDPAAWLRGIAVRVVAQHRRWRGVRAAKRWILRDLPAAGVAPVITPEQSTASAEEMEAVRAVLARLSPKLRDVLVLCDIEELAPQEAAEALDIPVNTVRSRRRLAKEKFLALWEKEHGK
jgi:RNA polymerase sigma-70 factor (ECF subfamily)